MLLEEDTQPRTQFLAWFQEKLWVLLWRGLLRKLEQRICTCGSQYHQVTKRMDHFLRRLPHLLGLQTLISNRTIHYWGWVYRHVTSTMWRHSHHELTTVNEGAELQGHLYWTLCLLQGIWRQCRSPETCKASKAMSEDQAHECLLSSFLQKGAKRAYQDLPHWHQRPDCWCTHKSSGTKWLLAHRRHMCGVKPLKATKVREWYVIGSILVLFRVLTYDTHITTMWHIPANPS